MNMRAIVEFQGEYRWLSNFWPSPVEYCGVVYPTVEHAYQAAKTLLPGERRRIREAETPGKAKRLGAALTVRPDWENIRLSVMLNLLRQKFSDPELGRRLLETGDALLVEGNRWGDQFWGVDLRTGLGENHLGKILMKVRDELRSNRGWSRSRGDFVVMHGSC